MPRDSVTILQKLLTREPDQRLGSGPTDAQEVMSQPFFRNINWDDIYNKRVQPPFLPQIKSATDTSNFDSEFTSVTPVLTPVQSGKLISTLRRRAWGLMLTLRSAVAGHAGGVPRVLLYRRLRVNSPQLMAFGENNDEADDDDSISSCDTGVDERTAGRRQIGTPQKSLVANGGQWAHGGGPAGLLGTGQRPHLSCQPVPDMAIDSMPTRPASRMKTEVLQYTQKLEAIFATGRIFRRSNSAVLRFRGIKSLLNRGVGLGVHSRPFNIQVSLNVSCPAVIRVPAHFLDL